MSQVHLNCNQFCCGLTVVNVFMLARQELLTKPKSYISLVHITSYCIVLYCVVLYCDRVPVANAPGCTAAEDLLYKPWSLVVPSSTARCLHQRPD